MESFKHQEVYDRIADCFFNHGYKDLNPGLLHKFTQLYIWLMKDQQRHNSTRIRNLKDVVIKHFIDSIIVDEKVKLKFPIMDLGTGPGFPGIPIAMLHPNETVFLVEGVKKRVDFLNLIRVELGLKNIKILGKKMTSDTIIPIKSCITRAFSDIKSTLELVNQTIPKDGEVYFMKGPSVDEEKVAKHNDFLLINDIQYHLPNTSNDRRLLIYHKNV